MTEYIHPLGWGRYDVGAYNAFGFGWGRTVWGYRRAQRAVVKLREALADLPERLRNG